LAGGLRQTKREEYRRVIENDQPRRQAGRTPTLLICAVIDRNSKSLSSIPSRFLQLQVAFFNSKSLSSTAGFLADGVPEIYIGTRALSILIESEPGSNVLF
jgi:hypothetical protein